MSGVGLGNSNSSGSAVTNSLSNSNLTKMRLEFFSDAVASYSLSLHQRLANPTASELAEYAHLLRHAKFPPQILNQFLEFGHIGSNRVWRRDTFLYVYWSKLGLQENNSKGPNKGSGKHVRMDDV